MHAEVLAVAILLHYKILQFSGTAAWRLSYPRIQAGSVLLHCPIMRKEFKEKCPSCFAVAAQQSDG